MIKLLIGVAIGVTLSRTSSNLSIPHAIRKKIAHPLYNIADRIIEGVQKEETE
jgi:hypothetical protein